MHEFSAKPRRIWLRSFYDFNPEDAGYIGWTDEGPRDRMLGLIEDGDLFMIYGATTGQTARHQRNRVLGFLQVIVSAIRDTDKASPAAIQDKKAKGWQDKWTYAIPVKRAWRVDEPILLERIAPTTYRPKAGQAIAVWNPPLLPGEIDLALKIEVTEVDVFGETPLSGATLRRKRFGEVFKPSRAFPGSFGERSATYEDGPTFVYLARFDGDAFALLGQAKRSYDKTTLVKIGVSNDQKRRVSELNAGFPPASLGRWKMALLSEPYNGRRAAEIVEQQFKDRAAKELRSLGGEFFFGDWNAAQILFSSLPGVSRFGR
jgi:hypothetical protein